MSAEGDSHIARLHNALRIATLPWHDQIDRHPMLARLLSQKLTESQYHHSLMVLYLFHQPVHTILTQMLLRHFPDAHYALPNRPAWLEQDLAQFQVHSKPLLNAHSKGVPPGDWARSHFLTPTAMLGWLYVVEGSALGGEIICTHVRQNLKDSPRIGTHFFEGMGTQTAAQWRSFWDFAAAYCPSTGIEFAAQAAANLFEQLSIQLDVALECEKAQNAAQ